MVKIVKDKQQRIKDAEEEWEKLGERRSRLETTLDVLESMHYGPRRITYILGDANLSHKVVHVYLGELEGKGYVEKNESNRSYSMIPSGLEFFERLRGVVEELATRGEARKQVEIDGAGGGGGGSDEINSKGGRLESKITVDNPPICTMEGGVLYFGVGANISAEMLKAITGRTPVGIMAEAEGYNLHIQKWPEKPEKVRSILSQRGCEGIMTYVMTPGNGTVVGTLWQLTKEERALVENWQLVGLWHTATKVDVKLLRRDGALGSKQSAETEIVSDTALQLANGASYHITFLNSKAKLLQAARDVRLEYLKGLGEKPKAERVKKIAV